MVAEIIEQHKDEIAALCRTYRVRALWVFGSAASDARVPGRSDLDFFVDLGDYSDDYATRFFTLRRALEQVTGQEVDLLSAGGPDSGWFRDEVEATKVSVYDARYDQLVA
jgi:predicted nucleotidyltransferase